MPSPTSSSSATIVGLTYSQNIDALLGGLKWGGVAGAGTILSYSFPWASGASANFYGTNGGSYSSLNEHTATYHYGLNTTQQAAARTALQSWANVAGINFQEIGDTATNVGDIRFAWTSAPTLTSTGTQAWGWSSFPSSYWPSAGDVWISTIGTAAANTDWSVGSYNYFAVIHEIGHALGLKHPFETESLVSTLLPTLLDTRQYSVMSYTDPINDLFRTITYTSTGFTSLTEHVPCETPMVLDIAAIQYLYGANMTYHTGDDVYSFDTATPFFKTIWDAGGNDTISVSNFAENCRIDLTPGNYSSIRILSEPIPSGYTVTGGTTPTYNGANNLGIAYNCIIENAIGGSGNDILAGNVGANILEGGAGNDTLTGGLGNDTIYGGAGSDTAIFSGIFLSYTLSYNTASGTYSISGSSTGNDSVSGVEFFQFGDITKTASQLLTSNTDSIAPTVTTFSPADAATGVALASNIVLTFSEAIQRGTGNIILKNAAGTVIETFDAATSNLLSITNSTLTINPANNLANNTNYFVTFSSGNIKDLAGNAYSGITTYDFTTIAATAPTNYNYTVTSNAGTSATAVTEGGAVTFTITRSGSGSASTVYWGTQAGTASAGAGDYESLGISALNFASNETIKTATVNTYTDTLVEGDEYFWLNIYNSYADATNWNYASYGTAHIKDPTTDTTAPTVTPSGLTKAKVYMGANDTFTVSDSGATLVGNLGTNTVKIASGVTGVKTDANFSRIELAGNLADYKLGVVAGTGLQIQTAAGVAVDTIVSLNNNVTLAFADGSATLAQTGMTAFKLGSLAISTTTPAIVPATLNTADTSSFGTATSRDNTKAKVYMGANDTFTVSDSGATLVGNLGTNTVKIASGVTGVKTDANFSRIELAGNLADYKLGVVAGTGLQIQTAAGIAVDTIVSLNNNVTLAFADGSATLAQTGMTAFKLGGLAISTTTPAIVPATLNTADTSSFGTTGNTVDVSAAGTGSAASGDITFNVHATSTFTYNLAGFAAGDQLVFDAGTALSVNNTSATDGIIDVTGTLNGQVATIHLTGIATASDGGTFNAASFNTAFGAGSLA